MPELIKNNIRLVSIHIPKTAGTSFRTVLREKYGKRKLAKVDIKDSGRILVDDTLFKKSSLDQKVTAIHGHYSYQTLTSRFELSADVQYLTWLRDPVQRVFSNYQFLNMIIADRLKEAEDENLMNRMGKTLEEFVSLEANQNVMSKFLVGADLSRFKFVGIQDNFDSELARLAAVMGWKKVNVPMQNVTVKKALTLTPQLISLIRNANKEDVNLFESVLKQREKESSSTY